MVVGRFSWDKAFGSTGIGDRGKCNSRDWSAQGCKRALGLQKTEDSVLLERRRRGTV